MGAGIAQVAALAGYQVALADSTGEALDAARLRIADSLGRMSRRGLIGEEAGIHAQDRLSFHTSLEEVVSGRWLVVEAIVEDLTVKRAVFTELDRLSLPDVVLATNTSQYPIHEVAEPCVHKGRVLGMHWSNPPPLMPLVELIVSEETTARSLELALDFLERCGKESVVCRRDVPGFISNRLSTALFMEAVRLVDEGVATAAEVDLVATKMFGHRMGPLATLDLAGIDTALMVSSALQEAYGGDRFTPPPLLHRLVDEGRFGRKSGSGFFDHPSAHDRGNTNG